MMLQQNSYLVNILDDGEFLEKVTTVKQITSVDGGALWESYITITTLICKINYKWAIFNSYVSLPEGSWNVNKSWPGGLYVQRRCGLLHDGASFATWGEADGQGFSPLVPIGDG